ncbi:MAG: hypothetical protein HDT33_02900 [Clostridiales bacterium]|nr:hypothetical protein [Clostridiales bacterium]
MPFGPDNIQRKGEAAYKTIYLRQRLIDQIEKIAAENETSFNSIVVSMIEQCLKDYSEKTQE